MAFGNNLRAASYNKRAAGFKIALVTATSGDAKKGSEDFNYLLFEDSAVETSRFEVEGKRDNAAGFEAFIYGERNIYRPGETIHFNTVIRKQDWQTPGSVPVKIRVLLPNGQELKVYDILLGNIGIVAER